MILQQFLLVADNRGTLAHIDAVQELADVLVLHRRNLLDGGRRLGDVVDGGTAQHNLVLLLSHVDSDTGRHRHAAHNLLTQVVADLNDRLVVDDGDVDGEVRVGGAHLVLEALGHTSDHVLDMGAHGSNAGNVLAGTEPDGNVQLVLALAGDLDRDVVKVLLQGAPRSGNLDLAAVQVDSDAFRNNNGLGGLDGFHEDGWIRLTRVRTGRS